MFSSAPPDFPVHILHVLNRPVPFIQRISADDALNHDWFCEVPLPKTKEFMPTFPALNEQDR
jgi:hypothetical protein